MRKWLAELRQRNVFKVATAYTVAGWVLIQLGSELFGNFGAPQWVPKAFTILIFLGFPVACLFAWALEVTPEGIRLAEAEGNARPRSSDWLWGSALLVTMLAAVFNLAYDWRERVTPAEVASLPPVPMNAGATTPAAETVPVSEEKPSVAVLPFENFSGNESEDYFSEGLADTILHQLAQIPGLTVIARNSSFQFKGEHLDVREVGSRLGVGTVLEGSVQRYGDQLRVIAQLVRTSDGSHAWSQSFDYRMADIFALQDAIATAVARQLKLTLLPADESRFRLGGTTNPAAYDLLLQARAEFEGLTPTMADEVAADDSRAMQLLDRALALDPDYVDAIVEKIEIYGEFAFLTTSNQRYTGYLDEASPLVDRALELAPTYAPVWAAKGLIARRQGNSGQALAAFEQALALNPNDARVHLGLAIQLAVKDPLAALDHMRIKRLLDPEDKFNRPQVLALLALNRVDEALAELNSDLASVQNVGYRELILEDIASIHYEILGRPDQSALWAARLLSQNPDNLIGRIGMARSWLAVGDIGRARAWLSFPAAVQAGSDYLKAQQLKLAIVAGDVDTAQPLLESIASFSGSWAELQRASWQFTLCYIADDQTCMGSVAGQLTQIRQTMKDEGGELRSDTARQTLMAAFVDREQGGSPVASARLVLEDVSQLPRASFIAAIGYMDAEAYVLQGSDDLAVQALEQTLLPGGGILPYDSLGLPAERGFILALLAGNPGFEDWKHRFGKRREALRKKMVDLEAAGDIPAPPAS